MSFRDHVIAAGLAGGVMAISLLLPHQPEVGQAPAEPRQTPAAVATGQARR